MQSLLGVRHSYRETLFVCAQYVLKEGLVGHSGITSDGKRWAGGRAPAVVITLSDSCPMLLIFLLVARNRNCTRYPKIE